MGGVARAVLSPISIIDKDLGKLSLQIVAVAALFVPGGQPVAALAALTLATLYKPKGPKPEQQERSIKMPIPPRVSAYGTVRLYGAYILFDTDGDGFAVDVWAFHDGQVDGIVAEYLGDKKVTLNGGGYVLPQGDGEFGDGDTIQIGTRLGLPTETAFSEVIARMPGIWTADHRGDGVVTGFMISKPVKSKNYNEVYPTGGPDANARSIVLRAQRVFDWRDPAQSFSDPATWTYSNNNALCIAHYYLVRANKDWETHFAPTIDYWTAFADDCDVAMPLKAGGTEPRYRVALAHKHTDPHKATLGNLLACCDGFVAPRSDGALVAFSGRYIEPDPEDMIGPAEIVSWSWDDGVVDEDQLNEIAVSYLSADHDYTVVDATAWFDQAAAEAAGEVKSTSLDNSVPSHAQARRLAKRLLDKTMAPYRGSITTNSAGRKIRGKRFIPLHIEEAGTVFFSGVAEVVRLRRTQTGVTFDWVRANPNIDDWDPATEEGDPAPVGEKVTPTGLTQPIITSATAQYSEDSGAGANGARILLVVTGPVRGDLIWTVRTREAGSDDWTERAYSDVAVGFSSFQILTEFVAIDASIEIEVAYQVGDGRNSPWSDPQTVGTSSSGLAPNPTTDVSAVGGVGQITPTWRNPASLNYSYTRCYYGVSSSFGSATPLSPDDAASPSAVRSLTFNSIPPGTYNVWTRAFSASGVGATPTKAPGTVTVT